MGLNEGPEFDTQTHIQSIYIVYPSDMYTIYDANYPLYIVMNMAHMVPGN